ncbi:MAG TPA: PDZ domain-containing protein [Silvibacterium sp.]|nr:PDZ domain-containing protein [Silvibacterium sp.]
MKNFPRLVCKASSITVLIGSTAFAPATFAAQLFAVVPESSALMSHSSQGYLGIEMRDIDNDRVAALKLKDASGAEIITVDHDAPAGKVGLRIHDVILQMNGQQIQGVEQLRRMLRETPAGRSIVLVVSRDGQQLTINVQLADRATIEQDAWSQHRTVPDLDDEGTYALLGPSGRGMGNGFFGAFSIGGSSVGVDLDPLGSQLADYFGIKDGQGLLVKHVAENSPASTAGLKAGDVITKVNGESMATLNTWMKTIHANRGKQVQITIVRNRKEQTVNLQAGDAKHKGELDGPDIDIKVFGPEGADFAQLDSQLKQLDPALLAQQAREAVRSLDMPKLQEEMKEQQRQMLDLQKDLDESLRSREKYNDMY